jgi:hypothetical protein
MVEVDSVPNVSAVRSLSRERSADAAAGELAADDASYAAGNTVDSGCSRGCAPGGAVESPATLSKGGVRSVLVVGSLEGSRG